MDIEDTNHWTPAETRSPTESGYRSSPQPYQDPRDYPPSRQRYQDPPGHPSARQPYQDPPDYPPAREHYQDLPPIHHPLPAVLAGFRSLVTG